jgi:hypothetical protein
MESKFEPSQSYKCNLLHCVLRSSDGTCENNQDNIKTVIVIGFFSFQYHSI